MERLNALLPLVLGAALSIVLAGTASATGACRECSADFELLVGGESVAVGSLQVDEQGNITLAEPVTVQGDGFTISLDGLTGNVDPFLIFALAGVNNTDNPLTFAAAFSLPIALSEPIQADASVSYSLTDGAGDGATLFPTSGTLKVVDSQDIRISPFLSTDKGVDVGDACEVAPGSPGAHNCGPYDASGVFGVLGGPTYDLMSVVVAFGLTPHDAAGVSGRVAQEFVPEPGTLFLLGSGLAGLVTFGRRRTA